MQVLNQQRAEPTSRLPAPQLADRLREAARKVNDALWALDSALRAGREANSTASRSDAEQRLARAYGPAEIALRSLGGLPRLPDDIARDLDTGLPVILDDPHVREYRAGRNHDLSRAPGATSNSTLSGGGVETVDAIFESGASVGPVEDERAYELNRRIWTDLETGECCERYGDGPIIRHPIDVESAFGYDLGHSRSINYKDV
jgi:hypothetical protein